MQQMQDLYRTRDVGVQTVPCVKTLTTQLGIFKFLAVRIDYLTYCSNGFFFICNFYVNFDNGL